MNSNITILLLKDFLTYENLYMFIFTVLSHYNFTCFILIRVSYFASIFLFMSPGETRQSYWPDVGRDSRRLRHAVRIRSSSSHPNTVTDKIIALDVTTLDL
jgi:hypothetical protein